jgi:hypothetical protein
VILALPSVSSTILGRDSKNFQVESHNFKFLNKSYFYASKLSSIFPLFCMDTREILVPFAIGAFVSVMAFKIHDYILEARHSLYSCESLSGEDSTRI